MKRTHLILTIVMPLGLASSFAPILAQEVPPQTVPEAIKVYEPTTYWVEAEQLRIRDNPLAGDAIGMLTLGQKILTYGQFENWVLISEPNEKQKWVNIDFLSQDRVTWARYNNNASRRHTGFNRSNVAKDVVLDRIRVPGDKSARLYAAFIKDMGNGNRIIVTRQNFRDGPRFEKRLVACNEDKATHMQLLGEGHTYMTMERDRRGTFINPTKDMPRSNLSDGDYSPTILAIAKFSCEAEM